MASVAGPNTSKPIIEILKANDIDPEKVCKNGQTAFEVLEAHVAVGLEAIESADDLDGFDEEDE